MKIGRIRNLSAQALAGVCLVGMGMAAPQSASATLITYSFTGTQQGSFQEDRVWHYDSSTGTGYYSKNDNCNDCATGSMHFTVDATRYTDTVASPGATSRYETLASAPWLSSTSAFTGSVMSDILTTGGDRDSGFVAYVPGFGGATDGHLFIYDYKYNDRTDTYDALGRLTSSKFSYKYNQISISGDIALGLVDGIELPTAISAFSSGWMYQYWTDAEFEYSYDASGAPSMTGITAWKYSAVPIDSVSITRTDPNNVPEPASLALLGLGLLGLGWSRTRCA